MEWHELRELEVMHRDATAEYLQTFGWDFFFTITCRDQRRDSLAFMRQVWGVLRDVGICRSFIAIEPHRSCSGLHAHGVGWSAHAHGLGLSAGKFLDEVPARGLATMIWRHLFDAFGRSKVDLIRNEGHVSAYCAKYIMKDGQGCEYNYMGRRKFWNGQYRN